jgi:MoaA/NifB/PqqE/SkfB family radical SAM enzyme
MILKDIEIELSSLCNARCPICIRTKREERDQDFIKRNVSLDEIIHIFNDFPLERRTMYMCGVMGDPLMNTELDDIIAYLIYEKNIKFIEVSTNAGLRNKKFWSELGRISKETGKLRIKFAIDGVTRNDYRVGVDVERAKSNMFYYTEAGGKAQWSLIKFDYNLDEIEMAAQICKERGIEFETRTSWKNTVETKNNAKTTKIKTVKREVSLKEIQKESKLKNIYNPKDISCKHYEDNHIYISSNLQVFPCCYLYDQFISSSDDYPDRAVLDNLVNSDRNNLRVRDLIDILTDGGFFDGGIKEIWQDPNQNLSRCWRSCGDCGDRLNKLEHHII